MTLRFSSFSIRARIVALFSVLIGLSVLSSWLMQSRIDDVWARVDDQATIIAGQRAAIKQQSQLIDRQQAIGVLAGRVTRCTRAFRDCPFVHRACNRETMNLNLVYRRRAF